jgi:hypothetical protein
VLRPVNLRVRLWNVPEPDPRETGMAASPAPAGSTIGSSEAAMFAGLALRRR